ncbi:MAG TPA: hypothetical protein VFK02_09335, partial [Kofleriaceae bacterium]|nr:hypothetical protein [Kofleriaceae bacterium]
MRATLSSGGRSGSAMIAVAVVVGLAALPAPARAESLPSGSLGVMFGAGAGTGRYAHKLGLGYYQFGSQASWQP